MMMPTTTFSKPLVKRMTPPNRLGSTCVRKV